MNSRNKGKVGERELAKYLQEHGYDARRSQQFCGINGDADVVGVDYLHIECKRCQQVRDEDFLKQAERDAREGEIPTVWYRRNREEWKVLMRSEAFLLIWGELTDSQKEEISKKLVSVDKIRKTT
jgi:Holliday junction resolvase